MITVIGKKSFVGKNGNTYFILFYGQRSDNVEGLEACHDFVSDRVYSKARINGRYNIIYSRSYSGKAVIEDLEPIRETTHKEL